MAGPQKPQYPHLEQITDPFAKMSLRLLWDAHRELQASQAALSTTVDTHAATLTSQQAAIDDATFLAQQAQSTTGKTVSASPNNIPIGTPQTPTTDLDNGMGEQGCSSSGSNGHSPRPTRRSPRSRWGKLPAASARNSRTSSSASPPSPSVTPSGLNSSAG